MSNRLLIRLESKFVLVWVLFRVQFRLLFSINESSIYP